MYFYCYVCEFLLLCLCILIVMYVLCIVSLCFSVYCLCVNVYCTTATGCQPYCSQQIYHIIYIISNVSPASQALPYCTYQVIARCAVYVR